MKINNIDSPIEQRNTGKGNPNAIIQFGRPLNNRQQALVEMLPDYDSKVIVAKDKVKMRDLAALTAYTGDEFAMFTKGNDRLLIRGNSRSVNVDAELAKKLQMEGYRWSGHTHPGVDELALLESEGDLFILSFFTQKQSVIYNAKGQYNIFGRDD